jgi:hypothetical protein
MLHAALPAIETTDSEQRAPSSAARSEQRTARLTGPEQPRQHIQTIDILRGFAIFGILLVNMEWGSSP